MIPAHLRRRMRRARRRLLKLRKRRFWMAHRPWRWWFDPFYFRQAPERFAFVPIIATKRVTRRALARRWSFRSRATER